MFRVLSEFADIQDSNHVYRVGDEYPRKGYSPSDERVEELSTNINRLHIPLIGKIETEEKPKRKRVRKNND